MSDDYNVILLICDSLRSDSLGCYGGTHHTPTFDAIADSGTVFESAFGTAPGTPVSHASLYTGQYPSQHGVTGQYIDLPSDIPLIAEWFRDAGYDTFGITGPAKMGSDWDYDRGFNELFEYYHDKPAPFSLLNVPESLVDRRFGKYFFRQITRGGREKTRYKFDLLTDRITADLDRPFFTVCNVLTVHWPYDPPRPFKRAATPGYSRPRLFLVEELLDRHGQFDDPELRMDRIRNVQEGSGIGKYLADPSYLNDDEVEVLRTWYGACVEYLDRQLTQFMELYRSEIQDDTILVVTADHGEQLGEHGLWGHSHGFYNETVKIPLVMTGPGVPKEVRRSDLASHVDVFDTLCDLCGIESPTPTDGNSLFEDGDRDAVFMEYGERDPDEYAQTRYGRHMSRSQLRSFCAGRKGVRTRDHRLEIDSNGEKRLFECPGDVEVNDAAIANRLETLLVDTLGEDFGVWPESDPEAVRMDEHVEDQLRDLGYID